MAGSRALGRLWGKTLTSEHGRVAWHTPPLLTTRATAPPLLHGGGAVLQHHHCPYNHTRVQVVVPAVCMSSPTQDHFVTQSLVQHTCMHCVRLDGCRQMRTPPAPGLSGGRAPLRPIHRHTCARLNPSSARSGAIADAAVCARQRDCSRRETEPERDCPGFREVEEFNRIQVDLWKGQPRTHRCVV